MAPSKAPSAWDDEESESTPPSSPPTAPAVVRRSKFDDEEDDSDVLDSWDAAEDSEVEREKVKKVAEAKSKAEAEAKANHKSRAQRIEEKRMENMRKKAAEEEETSDEEEDEADKRARLLATEQAGDLKHAEDLFGSIGVSDKRGAPKAVTVQEGDDPGNAVDLSSMKLFNPNTTTQWTKLRETLVPLLTSNSKKGQYPLFMAEFVKQITAELPSEQMKKINSGLTTQFNAKVKEEKEADKGGKKTKAAKTKVSLSANRHVAARADTEAYDDGLDEYAPIFYAHTRSSD